MNYNELYRNEIIEILDWIRRIKLEKRNCLLNEILGDDEEIKDHITYLRLKCRLAYAIKKYDLWRIEDIAYHNKTISIIYSGLLKDVDNEKASGCDYKSKKVVATDPEGNETTYDRAYRASLKLDVHSGVISRCCKAEGYTKSGTSKTTGIKYTFRYAENSDNSDNSGEPNKSLKRKNTSRIDRVIEKI